MLMFEEQLAYPTTINAYLILGSVYTLENSNFMKNVKCVISVMKSPPPIIDNVEQVCIQIEDNCDTNITEYFSLVFKTIEQYQENREKVLIHCEKGMSRSSSFVIAWLLQEEHNKGKQVSYQDVLRELVKKRSLISPNQGFAAQLRDFADQLNATLLSKDQEESNYIDSSQSTRLT